MKASAGAALVLLSLAAPRAWQLPGQEPPTFRSGVELVAVDVSVVDGEGRPVRDLTVGDFTLRVDGEVRELVSAEFVPLGATARTAVVGPRPAHYSTNAGAVGGRLIVFVVDRGNIRRGEGRALLAAAAQFVDRLDSADRLALAAIPDAGSYIDFTTNHMLVRKTLETLMGSATPPFGRHNVGLAEALAIERQDVRTFERVVARECLMAVETAPLGGRTASPNSALSPAAEALKECEDEVRSEARLIFGTSRQQASASLTALRNLLGRLALVSGPKSVVLLSEGLFVDVRERGELEHIASAAAAASAMLYAVGLDTLHADASTHGISATLNDDRLLRREGLEVLVGMARGRLLSMPTGSRAAFDRIARELSGYYLLSFEPGPGDRDRAERAIDVEVRRRGVEVRARRHFLVDRSSSRPAQDVLVEILRAPLPATDLLMRTATFVYPADGQQLRVVIAAEIEGATVAGPIPCGFSLADARGQILGAEVEGPRAAAQPRGDLHAYLGSFVLDPGRYTLKLAVVDALGRRGSVEHGFEARLTPAGQLRVGDLMLADAPHGRTRDVRPSIETRMTSDELIGYVELASDVPVLLDRAQVALEVAASESTPALSRADTRIEATTVRRRVAEGRVPTDALPPGEYLARAVVSVGQREVAQVSRPFRVERPLAAAARTAVAGAVVPRPASPRPRGPAGLAGVESFTADRVLRPEVVGYFLDRLPRNTATPLAGPVAVAATAAREGRFGDIETALVEAGDADLTAVFLRGLAHLARGELDPAAQEFRRTLRLSSEFFPAAFYLGACHAAGGRDDEAAGAWQTSLVSDTGAPFTYELLGDALLRLEEGQQAVDVLGEASALWPADDRFLRRLAIAHAVARHHAEALPALERYLQARPDDRDGWLLAAWLVYDARLSGRQFGNAADDLARLDRYRVRYIELGGSQAALVSQWRKAIERGRER